MEMLFPGAIDYSKILSVKEKLLQGWQKRRIAENRKRSEQIHVSDLIYCPRRVCFERLDNNAPPIPDEKKVKYLFGGKIKHLVLEELLEFTGEFEIEKEIVWTGKSGITLVGHADLVHKETRAVIELKTNESTRVLKEGPYEHHLSQIKSYMSMTDAPYGIIL